MLPRLTSLRAFAALAVVLNHLSTWGVVSLPGQLSQLGYVGVAFFFVLSGFVLAWGTQPGLPPRRFYRRRFARVWPSHVTMLCVAAVVPVVSVARGWVGAVANGLLVQAWFLGRPDVQYGMNGPSWSLSCEAFFYAVFPLAAWLVRKLPRWTSWSAAGALLLVALVADLVSPEAAYAFPPVRVSEFVLGLVAGMAVRDGWRPRIRLAVAGLVLVAGLGASLWLPDPVPDTVMAVPFLLVILSAARLDLAGRVGWLPGRALVFAGEASFAFYLVHELVIVNLRQHLTGIGVLDAVILVAIAAVCAVALHLGVERPCNRLLRDRSPSVALRIPG
jgi:peptidoglycan/LPS O-acetylase OafA/YrhL